MGISGIKYKLLAMVGVLILLIFFNSLMIFNLLGKQKDDALLVNLAGRQRMLSQVISKNTFLLINNDKIPGSDKTAIKKELNEAVTLFDDTINTFISGGRVIDANGREKLINNIGTHVKIAESVVDIWKPFKTSISEVLNGNSTQAASIIYATNNELLKRSNDIVVVLQMEAESKVQQMKNIQYGVSLAALILFFIVSMFMNKAVINPLNYIVRVVKDVAGGDFSKTVKYTSKDEIGILATSFNSMIENISYQASIAYQIAKGEEANAIEIRSENDILNIALDQAVKNLNILTLEIETLVKHAQQGDLSKRANTSKLDGRWAKLINEVNGLMTSVEKPITLVCEYSRDIAAGKIICISSEGFEGEFKDLLNSMDAVSESLNILILQTGDLIQGAKEGNLNVRGDISLLKGEFANIINGFNQTLDLITSPINEATAVLSEVAHGNFNVRVVGDYKGDYAIIKNALNLTVVSIEEVLKDIIIKFSQMAKRDYSTSIDKNYSGDWNQLKIAFNEILLTTNSLFKEILISSGELKDAASSLSASSQSLSQGVVEQTATIDEINSNINIVAAEIKDNAKKAVEVDDLISFVNEKVEQSNQRMDELQVTMTNITDSSNSIMQIIKVIDDIAFQTNILALNAAVEAARAGQHGKGFAVVAEEVRNLATRSAKAAKHTAGLIDLSISHIQEGEERTVDTANVLSDILNDIHCVSNLMKQVSVASNKQASLVAEIGTGISQMAQAIKISSNSAEHTAMASEDLTHEALKMNEIMQTFNLIK